MKRMLPVILALLFAGAVFANGLGGERLEKVVGDLIVDIGTDQTSTPVAGEPIEFDFNLLKSDTREPIGLATNIGIRYRPQRKVDAQLRHHHGRAQYISLLLISGGRHVHFESDVFRQQTYPAAAGHCVISAYDFGAQKQDAATVPGCGFSVHPIGTFGGVLGISQAKCRIA